ncbi:hypothetical protein [Kitasatospora sp. NPDC090091]|uniref:hypothetical protein n=1 Tax=Kitasatospora sp. NPDC090091 TaxID=3364081 RepID=UPI003812F18B
MTERTENNRAEGRRGVVQSEQLSGLTPAEQRQVAALVLRQWRAPLIACEPDEVWGIDRSVLESLFRLAAEAPGEQRDQAYRQALAVLRTAPLFTSEVDPDTVQLVQLETIGNLLTFGGLLEDPPTDKVDLIIESSAGLASYLDGLVEDSYHSHPSEHAHRQYLADLGYEAHGLGYLAARRSAVESACHRGLRSLPDRAGLLDSSTGRELLGLCEDFGAEVATTLQWIRTTGR